MKWFKHFTDASDDDFIEELEKIFGLEGYARWWKMLEVIGIEMDKNRPDPCASHTWEKWCSKLKAKRNKLEQFLQFCSDKNKIKMEGLFSEQTRNKSETNPEPTGTKGKQISNVIKITCPKLLELRDEYYRKSGHTPEPVQTLPYQEAEADKESIKKTTPLPPTESKPDQIIPIPKYNLEPKKILNNDFNAAAAACCSLLYRRNLSPVDRTLLVGWCERYDFIDVILPVLEKKTKSHATKNNGKPPATLSYFVDAISEATSRPRPPTPP